MVEKYDEFAVNWALRWAEGTVLGFMRGNIDLGRAVGMLQTAAEIIGNDRLLAIIENIEKNPIYLPSMSNSEKVAKLKSLRARLK